MNVSKNLRDNPAQDRAKGLTERSGKQRQDFHPIRTPPMSAAYCKGYDGVDFSDAPWRKGKR